MQTAPMLPSDASNASLARLQLAGDLTAHCPPSLGAAIALTGSSARGLADTDSDAEINHWVEQLPPLSLRAAYLAEAGVTDIELEPKPRSDDSEWFQGSLNGIPVEVGWQTLKALDHSLRPVFRGESTETDALRLGELLASAVMLRGSAPVTGWQQALIQFPDPLRDRLIGELSAPMSDAAYWATAEKLARRGERLAVVSSLAGTLNTAVRLCFAVNRRWEVSDKWLLTLAARLPVMPTNWRARLDTALSATPVLAVTLSHDWCADALSLPR